MPNEIISYLEMCRREGVSLQRGMNFGLSGNHSVILMSVRPNAPYEDELQEGGTVLIYEGHDGPRGPALPDPKRVDQPQETPSGSLTQNGLFHRAALQAMSGERSPERSGYTRNFDRECGHTTASSTSSTPGASRATAEKSLN